MFSRSGIGPTRFLPGIRVNALAAPVIFENTILLNESSNFTGKSHFWSRVPRHRRGLQDVSRSLSVSKDSVVTRARVSSATRQPLTIAGDRALMTAWNECSRSRRTGAQDQRNTQSGRDGVRHDDFAETYAPE